MVDGTDRRVLADISSYPAPKTLLKNIKKYQPLKPYKRKPDFYLLRDKALASTLFAAQLRKSEAHRLTKEQFLDDPFRICGVELSKSHRKDSKTGKTIMRKELYRKEIFIPSNGELGGFGQIIKSYLDLIDEEDRLFPFADNSGRDNQIIGPILGIPPHWLRAYGENWLYELFDYDLIAVANYVQVDPRTLSKYIHRTPIRFLKRLQ